MVKRKFSDELLDTSAAVQFPRQAKRQFSYNDLPSATMDVDMAMDCDASAHTSSSTPEQSPTALPAQGEAPSQYPAFDLYPLPSFAMDCDMGMQTNNTQPTTPVDDAKVGIMQPTTAHVGGSVHGPHCTSIPKLRLSCSAGLMGRRTMWTHCEQCGAIEMVE
ncbi:hypothetical protein EXIGLDRAFT_702935 [Exidia glandulosa HHB12029]|uniref:Uncharacterized protein n=1 Tax=Exidia glandulosa HHB12029 TaxID=1314781 RepID=A0A165CAV2_EXIGL|nr:hypothetical protein EXIGLDRAFT_702935 [Exidia glandulosa HHB12029]